MCGGKRDGVFGSVNMKYGLIKVGGGDGGRERGREGEREGGREGGRERGREEIEGGKGRERG